MPNTKLKEYRIVERVENCIIQVRICGFYWSTIYQGSKVQCCINFVLLRL